MFICVRRVIPRGNPKIDLCHIIIFYMTRISIMNTNNDIPTPRSSLTRMFSCPTGYEMTEEEHRYDQASNEERANTVWSWSRPNPSQFEPRLPQSPVLTPPVLTPPVLTPPVLTRQTAMGVVSERPPSRRMTMGLDVGDDAPPRAPPRLTRQNTYYPPPPVLIRENAMEPIYRDDLEAQIKDLQRQMMEMREQIAFLLQKIETKE